LRVRYKVLGPVELVAGGGWQPIGSTKGRILLSVLLSAADQVVSADRLEEELWAGEPPPSAAKLLQGYISQLRRRLGAASDNLRTHKWGYRAYGYQLLVVPGESDVNLFEARIEQSLGALSESDYPGVLGPIEEALALWRGQPFSDVPSTSLIAAESKRLRELWLQAREARIEARSHLTGDGVVLAEVESLAAEWPLRERPTRLLMLALHRADRPGDALAAYRRLRDTLVGELGIEPSASIQRVHQQILAADELPPADDDRPPVRPEPVTVIKPAARSEGLPAPVALSGREEVVTGLVERLADAWQGPGATIVVHGIGGVGKSVVAIEAARRLADRFPGRHLYVDLHGSTAERAPLTPAAAMRRMLQAVGSGVGDDTRLDEMAEQFWRRVSGGPLLLMFDNARDAEQLFPLLPLGGPVVVLATSRTMLTELDDAQRVPVDVLRVDAAVSFLERILEPGRVAAEPEAARAIVTWCDGLPLALRIVGARLTARPGWSLTTFAERLCGEGTRLDQLRAGKLTVRASFEVSYGRLERSPDPLDRLAASAFRLLGLLNEPRVGAPAAAMLLAQPTPITEAALGRLVDARLAEETRPGQYHLRSLLRLFAREKSGNAAGMRISELVDSREALSSVRRALRR
jgi:DNA-binding SARP family transcriptional activator